MDLTLSLPYMEHFERNARLVNSTFKRLLLLGGFKEFYNQAAEAFSALLPSENVRKADFLSMFMAVRLQALTVRNIENAFEATGIHPVNCHPALIPSNSSSQLDVLRTPSNTAGTGTG